MVNNMKVYELSYTQTLTARERIVACNEDEAMDLIESRREGLHGEYTIKFLEVKEV